MDGEEVGTILLSVMVYAERAGRSSVLDRALKAAEMALFELPDAHESPSLVRLSRVCRQKRALDALLEGMSQPEAVDPLVVDQEWRPQRSVSMTPGGGFTASRLNDGTFSPLGPHWVDLRRE